MSVSRWLAWTPPKATEIIEKRLEPAPPKLTKPDFGGFAGSAPGTLPIIEQPPSEGMRPGRLMGSSFPHCPRCAGYALYRKNNVGKYECLTCNLLESDEAAARRLQ